MLFYVIFQVFDVRLPIGQAVYYANFFCIKMHYLVSLRQQYQASYVRMIYIYIFFYKTLLGMGLILNIPITLLA